MNERVLVTIRVDQEPLLKQAVAQIKGCEIIEQQIVSENREFLQAIIDVGHINTAFILGCIFTRMEYYKSQLDTHKAISHLLLVWFQVENDYSDSMTTIRRETKKALTALGYKFTEQ